MEQREIKFRAWFKGSKIREPEMIYIDDLYWFEENGITQINDEYGFDYVFMQYTGLHDKNGEEIYEGDIVKINHDVAKVKYDGCGFIAIKSNGDEVERHIGYSSTIADFGYVIEVVGDIYENPGLLKN